MLKITSYLKFFYIRFNKKLITKKKKLTILRLKSDVTFASNILFGESLTPLGATLFMDGPY